MPPSRNSFIMISSRPNSARGMNAPSSFTIIWAFSSSINALPLKPIELMNKQIITLKMGETNTYSRSLSCEPFSRSIRASISVALVFGEMFHNSLFIAFKNFDRIKPVTCRGVTRRCLRCRALDSYGPDLDRCEISFRRLLHFLHSFIRRLPFRAQVSQRWNYRAIDAIFLFDDHRIFHSYSIPLVAEIILISV